MVSEQCDQNNRIHFFIPFIDSTHRLTTDWLDQQVDDSTRKSRAWCWPTLKFLSYEQGHLLLSNSFQGMSFHLSLQVRHEKLEVYCSCNGPRGKLCQHAYAALYVIVWRLGDLYFHKLIPNGTLDMAMRRKPFFDKIESSAGMDAVPRPELESVFGLMPGAGKLDLPALCKSPDPCPEATPYDRKRVMAYCITVPIMQKMLPGVLPCIGILNKQGSDIRVFQWPSNGMNQISRPSISKWQEELQTNCFELWKMIEKTPGSILTESSDVWGGDCMADIFGIWKAIFPMLSKEPFVYTCPLAGLRALRKNPSRQRLEKICLSPAIPDIRFVLTDKGTYFILQMQVYVLGNKLTAYDTGMTFFIRNQQTLYMLRSLRDAALAAWMQRCGGLITIFKEQFAQFNQEVLTHIQDAYPVKRISGKAQMHA